MASLEKKLDAVELIIKNETFRQNKGLGNEVGYYVFDYPSDKELAVRERINYMKTKNLRVTDGFELVVFDIYDIMIDILEAEGYMDQCYGFEKQKGLDKVLQVVDTLLLISNEDNLIIKYIQENTPKNAVVFLTGIGKCYPILRSHKILNNLHQVMDRVPVVLFYPGEYDGQELVLFSSIKDDNYYRAFKLVD